MEIYNELVEMTIRYIENINKIPMYRCFLFEEKKQTCYHGG